MFSAKLNAFESILLVCIFLWYQLATLRRSRLPQRASLQTTVCKIQTYSCKVKPPLSKFLLMPLIKKTSRFFYVKIVTQASEQKCC